MCIFYDYYFPFKIIVSILCEMVSVSCIVPTATLLHRFQVNHHDVMKLNAWALCVRQTIRPFHFLVLSANQSVNSCIFLCLPHITAIVNKTRKEENNKQCVNCIAQMTSKCSNLDNDSFFQ